MNTSAAYEASEFLLRGGGERGGEGRRIFKNSFGVGKEISTHTQVMFLREKKCPVFGFFSSSRDTLSGGREGGFLSRKGKEENGFDACFVCGVCHDPFRRM